MIFARSKYGQFKHEVTCRKDVADELIMKREKHWHGTEGTKRKIEDMVKRVKQKAQEQGFGWSVLQSTGCHFISGKSHDAQGG